MKRLVWPLLITLMLVACSRKDPTPTSSPSPTLAASSTPLPRPTHTPGPPVSRITIVPSATRWQPTPSSEPADVAAPPTSTVEPSPTLIPSSTPTTRVIDANASDTPSPTATLPDSPLPTSEPPRTPSPGTPSPTITPTVSPTSSGADDTPTPTVEAATSIPASSTPTSTSTPTAPNGDWSFENVYTFYDDEYQEFYVWGEAVNDTSGDKHLTTLWPRVYGEDGNPVTSKDDVDAIGTGYKELREGISLAPGARLAFSFLVYLPPDVSVTDNYDMVVAAEPAEPGRDDLEIADANLDYADWPYYLYVDGVYDNRDLDLDDYVAVVVTLYDDENRVIGVGWLYEEGDSHLTAGKHDFEITVELWEVVSYLGLEVDDHEAQVFGH